MEEARRLDPQLQSGADWMMTQLIMTMVNSINIILHSIIVT